MAQYAGAKGVPQPEAAVLGSGALLAVGGASILLGAKPKIGSLAILAFLAGVSPTMHDFWNEQDPMQKQNSMIHFMKNLALFGGALALMGVEEPWPLSVEHGESAQVEEKDAPVPRLSEKRRRLAKAA